MRRREFIKCLGLAVSGMFFASLPGKIFGNPNTPLNCSHCGARVTRWNSYGDDNKKGVFCPNCGIEVRKGSFMLRSSADKTIYKSKKKRAVNRQWECALVPFPNPDLVMQTGKPKMKLANMKF